MSVRSRDRGDPGWGTPGAVALPRGRSRAGYFAAKRAMDVVASVLGLVLASPILAVAALAVRLTSAGPVLFRQPRVGRRGQSFEILKFRSMRTGMTGPSVTRGGDARITPVGKILRRSKVDELPQLWNVLVGDMSLVGPRPEMRKFVDLFRADYARILSIRPGITDYAAIDYRDEEVVLATSTDPETAYTRVVLPAKIKLYHRYLDDMSLRTDVTLILRTLAALFR
jgi:lipopolysaccharide/colanic/teichoic acid biosynthesis glycosyltransferase